MNILKLTGLLVGIDFDSFLRVELNTYFKKLENLAAKEYNKYIIEEVMKMNIG